MRRFSVVAATLVATVTLGAFSALAEDYGGDANPLVCGVVREQIKEAEGQLNSPRLNQFLFRASDEGCATRGHGVPPLLRRYSR